jgi:hypothetical protein
MSICPRRTPHRGLIVAHSGKWNHHYFAWPLNEATSDVARGLKKIAVLSKIVDHTRVHCRKIGHSTFFV